MADSHIHQVLPGRTLTAKERRQPIGELPSQVLARQVRALRKRLDWTQEDLAWRLQELGTSMDQSMVARIENGKRAVSLDEMFVLAGALDVSPAALVMPRESGQVRVAPVMVADSFAALEWLRGIDPSPPDWDDERYVPEFRSETEDRADSRFAGVTQIWQEAHRLLGLLGGPKLMKAQIARAREQVANLKDDIEFLETALLHMQRSGAEGS